MSVPEKFLKPYNPNETEDSIYQKWEKDGFFNPDNCIKNGVTAPDAPVFSMVLPPPNVTGTLHMGHAAMLVIEDIMTRYKRMRGFRTLWLPGTDHAAIATQSKVESIIYKEEGLRRQDLGREELLKRVNKFANESHDTIVNQMKKMGASVDWSREAFTLDEKRNLAVRTAFKKMYDDGLIYRGHRIVNWDPKGQTTISDDEIVYIEEKTKFYYLKYGPFTIATARPETKFGDKYVVMHPDDKRYANYKHGQEIDLEWINGPIRATIIKDESIDMAFGTGVMTITPWHSVVDFEIAERHTITGTDGVARKLDKEQIIDKYGKLLPIAGPDFAGMKIADARKKIIEKLAGKGLVVKEEDYTHNIATAERTGGIVEPQIMNQWFIDVNKKIPARENKSLKELMLEAGDKIEFIPDRFGKIYINWINNLRDWCISRQIWYGHRIPVWYKGTEGDKKQEIHVGDAPADIKDGIKSDWIQDEDTLDTWFSSGLWTFSTLGWPEKTNDFKTYHPISVMETGADIIFFWVARMILMSTYILGEIPFEKVYFHGIVRNNDGSKMSKSKGAIDPLDMCVKYGTDAVRMSLIIGTGPGNDTKMSEDKIRAYKNFANKLWNIARYVMTATDGYEAVKSPTITKEDSAVLTEFEKTLAEVTEDMESFRYSLAGEKLYAYVWHTFADIIIEQSKPRLASGDKEIIKSTQYTLLKIFSDSLRALHPFAPFVTEEIWTNMHARVGTETKPLIVQTWPVARKNK